MNQAYCDAALAGELAKLRSAGPGTTNTTLIAVACRYYEFVNAGALTEAEADRILTEAARAKHHNDSSIRNTLKSAKDRTRGQKATIPEKDTPRTLADYERERGAVGAYAAADWKQVLHKGRPALRFCDETGMPRYRFLDDQEPKYWHASGHHTDANKGWYRLDEALRLAHQRPQPLVLCNGESSVVAAQAHGVAATCITGGGERTLPQRLLDELLAAWPGAILIALDCDDKGRTAAPKLAQQLQDAGRQARAVDLKLGEKQDLADFCARRNGTSVDALASCISLAADTPTLPNGYVLYNYAALATLPPASWLVDGEIPANGLSMLVGPSRGGKSFVMTDRAIRVALAHPSEAVIYIAPEGGTGYRKRMDAWCQHHGIQPPENLYFILDTVPLLDASKRDLFLASLGSLKPILIVVDTLARSMIGGDENSTKDMGLLIDACDQLRKATGAAVQLVHHSGKNGSGYRGSSALFGACDVVVELSNDDGLITLSCGKSKDSAEFEPMCYRLVAVGESCVVLPAERVILTGNKLTSGQRKILETLNLAVFVDCGAKHSQICDVAALASPTVYKALSTLKTRGLISQGTKGDPYHITEEGQTALAPSNYTNSTYSSQDSSSTNYTNYTYSSQDSSPCIVDSSAEKAIVQPELSNDIALPDAQLSQLSSNYTQLSDSSLSTISPIPLPVKGEIERVDSEIEEDGQPSYQTITLRDGSTLKELVLTAEWQIVPAGWTVPAGAEIQMDLQGSTKARLSYDPIAACDEALDRRSWIAARPHLDAVAEGPERERLQQRYQAVKASWLKVSDGPLFE